MATKSTSRASSLDQSSLDQVRILTKTSTEQQRKIIAKAIFGDSFAGRRTGRRYFGKYFDYYDHEIHYLEEYLQGDRTDRAPAAELAVGNHRQLLRAVEILQKNSTAKKSALRTELSKMSLAKDTPVAQNRALDLSVRMFLMINIREESLDNPTTAAAYQWSEDTSLLDLVTSLFKRSDWNPDRREGRLHVHFTAANMERFCGLEVQETSSLADHLRLDHVPYGLKGRKTTVSVFQHRHVLLAHREAIRANTSPFPDGLIGETLETLDLLFPADDPDSREIFGSTRFPFHQLFEGPATRKPGYPSRNLIDYPFWRDRLSDLHDEVYERPAASWDQLWNDKRNPQLYWTFWIALAIAIVTVLAFLISIAALIISGIQTWG